MTDLELMRFSTANETLRMEREPNGEILVMTPAGAKTSNRNARIAYALFVWAEEDGRGLTFDCDGGFTLADKSVRAADAAWVSLSRWERLTEEQQEGFAPICPEFVIELRSPSDGLAGLRAKMEQWMGNGALVGWMIDPKGRTVSIYRAGQEVEELVDPSSVVGDGPVRGFELMMGRVWG